MGVVRFLSVITVLVLMPGDIANAQQLLTCNSGASCNFCELARTINNVVDWLVVVATLIAVIGLMYAGFRMATSRGDVTTFTYAKTLFGNVVIGIFIIATAWLIIDVIVKSLTGGDFGVWNEPAQCGSMFQEGVRVDTIRLENSGVVNLSESSDTVTYEFFSPGGVSNISSFSGNLEEYAGHRFDSNIVSQVNYIARTYDLRVSGGHRTPERNAQVGGVPNSLHLSGRAADFVGSRERMEAAASWARANGASEVLIHDAGSGTHLHVGW